MCLLEGVGLISSFLFANPHVLGVSFAPEKENMSRRGMWCFEYQILSAAANCSPAQSNVNIEVVTGCLNIRLGGSVLFSGPYAVSIGSMDGKVGSPILWPPVAKS